MNKKEQKAIEKLWNGESGEKCNIQWKDKDNRVWEDYKCIGGDSCWDWYQVDYRINPDFKRCIDCDRCNLENIIPHCKIHAGNYRISTSVIDYHPCPDFKPIVAMAAAKALGRLVFEYEEPINIKEKPMKARLKQKYTHLTKSHGIATFEKGTELRKEGKYYRPRKSHLYKDCHISAKTVESNPAFFELIEKPEKSCELCANKDCMIESENIKIRKNNYECFTPRNCNNCGLDTKEKKGKYGYNYCDADSHCLRENSSKWQPIQDKKKSEFKPYYRYDYGRSEHLGCPHFSTLEKCMQHIKENYDRAYSPHPIQYITSEKDREYIGQYEELIQDKYREWNFEDDILGIKIRNKTGPWKVMVHTVTKDGIHIFNEFLKFGEIYDNYTLLDGTPCGVKL